MDNVSVITCARYIVEHNCTIRNVAKVYGFSKSGVHYDIVHKLPLIDRRLYKKVRVVLDNNFALKHIRGGQATKIKYKNMTRNKK